MKSRQGYKGYFIVARSCELQDGGFAAEFSVEEHDADGVMETEFYLPDTFPTQESALEAGIQAGRQKIDAGFERGDQWREWERLGVTSKRFVLHSDLAILPISDSILRVLQFC